LKKILVEIQVDKNMNTYLFQKEFHPIEGRFHSLFFHSSNQAQLPKSRLRFFAVGILKSMHIIWLEGVIEKKVSSSPLRRFSTHYLLGNGWGSSWESDDQIIYFRVFQTDDCIFQSGQKFVNWKCQLVLYVEWDPNNL
jgi:hypothetical protein